MLRFFCILFVCSVFCLPVQAQEVNPAFRSTDYPLPRFISLRSDEVRVRTGPGQKYPVKWMFKKKGLPVEVTLEYEHWRKIKDHEGASGWVHHSLLSGKRTGLMHGEDVISMHRKAKSASRVVAYIEPLALVGVESCEDGWCDIEATGYRGWVRQKYIWGVYPDEEFD